MTTTETTVTVTTAADLANAVGLKTSTGWALVHRVADRQNGTVQVVVIKKGKYSDRWIKPGTTVEVKARA